MRHRDVRDQALAEKALRPRKSPVYELADDDEIARYEVLTQAADCGQRDDVGHAATFQRVDIGAEIDVRRRQHVAAAVTRNEHDRLTIERAKAEFVRGRTERALDSPPLDIGEPVDLVETATPDDTDDAAGHPCASMYRGPDLALGRVEYSHGDDQEQHHLETGAMPHLEIRLGGPSQERHDVMRHLRYRRGDAVGEGHGIVAERRRHRDLMTREMFVVLHPREHLEPRRGFLVAS